MVLELENNIRFLFKAAAEYPRTNQFVRLSSNFATLKDNYVLVEMRINAPTQLYSILFDEAAHEKTHKDIW
jgi:hypothetical protein